LTNVNCEHYEQLASAFADGELRADETGMLQEHLEGCEGCRAFLGGVYRVRDLLQAGDADGEFGAVREGFAGGVSAIIAREKFTVTSPRRRKAASFFGRMSAAAAAAVLVASVGWSWLSLSATGDGTPAGGFAGTAEADEGSMASYLRTHAMQSMDATFLGSGEGIELASFEVLGQGFD
jgi:anti-sigma factor RsiW